MSLRWEQAVAAAADPVALGQWWAEALGWTIVNDDPEDNEFCALAPHPSPNDQDTT